MDGWNRIDDFNILANPYTTTRPAVTLGERRQFTQIEEPFTDDFVLADAEPPLRLRRLRPHLDHVVHVPRHPGRARRRGADVQHHRRHHRPAARTSTRSTRRSTTRRGGRVDPGGARGGRQRPVPVGGGRFYSDTARDYGQSLLVPGFEELPASRPRGLRAPQDTLFFSDSSYNTQSVRALRRGDFSFTTAIQPDGRPALLRLQRGQGADLRRHLRAGQHRHGARRRSRAPRGQRRRAALHREPTSCRTRQPERAGLEGVPARRHQRPAQRSAVHAAGLVTFGGRETWRTNGLELRDRRQVADLGGHGSSASPLFYMDINDLQATVTAGSCSSRVVFNVPKARSRGVEVEFERAPTGTSTSPSPAASTMPSCGRRSHRPTRWRGHRRVGHRRGATAADGAEVSVALGATYQWEVRPGIAGYVTARTSISARVTHRSATRRLGTLDLLPFGANTIGGPLTPNTFTTTPSCPPTTSQPPHRPAARRLGRRALRQQRDRRAWRSCRSTGSGGRWRASAT